MLMRIIVLLGFEVEKARAVEANARLKSTVVNFMVDGGLLAMNTLS